MKYVPGKRPARMTPIVLATRGTFTAHTFPQFDHKSISALLGQLWRRGLLKRIYPSKAPFSAIYQVAK